MCGQIQLPIGLKTFFFLFYAPENFLFVLSAHNSCLMHNRCYHILQRSCQYLVSADFLIGPVDAEERHVVTLAGDELLADGEDVVSACGRIVEDRVDGEERDDGQNLLSAGEIRRDQQSLMQKNTLTVKLQPENNSFSTPNQINNN